MIRIQSMAKTMSAFLAARNELTNAQNVLDQLVRSQTDLIDTELDTLGPQLAELLQEMKTAKVYLNEDVAALNTNNLQVSLDFWISTPNQMRFTLVSLSEKDNAEIRVLTVNVVPDFAFDMAIQPGYCPGRDNNKLELFNQGLLEAFTLKLRETV